MRAPLVLLALLVGFQALARPTAPALFCQRYPTVPACSGQTATCLTCHTAPPQFNLFGLAVQPRLGPVFDTSLAGALAEVEPLDSDGDGTPNLAELQAGTLPGDTASRPASAQEPDGDSPYYRLGRWDESFALRRVLSAFCGASPTYSDMKALKAAANPRAFVHQRLTSCLASTFWREEQLPRLADSRVRPMGSAGSCVSLYGNFEPDYALFTYVMTGGRDVRELLTAQYHVRKRPDGALEVIDESAGPIQAPARRAGLTCRDRYGYSPPRVGGQPLAKDKRAGMLTTQWFLWRNTMGALVPRGTAALAYKAWLGFDISQHEGLYPVASEPRDIDLRNVAREPCSYCHSTLDPLAYAFASYWGGVSAQYPELTGTFLRQRYTYLPDVPASVKQDWTTRPPRPHLFGQPLPLDTETTSSSLVELARRAADSDPFARNLTQMLFEYAVGHAPAPEDQAEFDALWRGLRRNGYSADALLHALVDTNAIGAP